MEEIKINGISLAYDRCGQGTPIILIHGYPLDHVVWGEIAALLNGTFDVITPDLRGFGQSTIVDSPYTIDDMAADLAGVLDHLGVEKTLIAGHSMGGYVALSFARSYSNRVLGLGMVSSQAIADSPERKRGRYDTATQVAEKGVGIVADAMTAKLSADAGIQAFLRPLIERQSPGGIIGALRAMAERPDSTFVLRSFKFPMVIVHGDADQLIPVERARDMKAVYPRAHLVELSNVGHMPMMEAAEKTAEALLLMR